MGRNLIIYASVRVKITSMAELKIFPKATQRFVLSSFRTLWAEICFK